MVESSNQLHGISFKLWQVFALPTGRILVEGLYDDVQEPNERELALVETYAQRNPEEISQIYGLELPLLQEERTAFLKRFFFEPALNIEGIQSGYQGQGVKTILPAEASAKLESSFGSRARTSWCFG